VQKIPAYVTCALLALSLHAALGADGDGSSLAKVLAKMPADSAETGRALCEEILKLGRGGIQRLIGMLVEPGKGDDAKPRQALHALALYASRPDAGAQRRLYAGAIAKPLSSDVPRAVKKFLIQQLRFVADAKDVAALGELLLDPELCEPAAQAILSSSTSNRAVVFHEALAKAKGGPRVVIVTALGQLRDGKSVPTLMRGAVSEDSAVRQAALHALSNIGDPVAAQPIARAMKAASGSDRSEMTHAYLRFIQRLGEEGHKEQAVRLCRLMVKEHSGDVHIQCACLTRLAKLLGGDAVEDIMTAMSSDEPRLRDTARRLAVVLPADCMAPASIAKMLKGAPPRKHAEILRALAERGAPSGFAAAREGLKNADRSVRLAAIVASARLGRAAAVPGLVDVLSNPSAGRDERDLARLELSRIPGQDATRLIVEATKTAKPAARAELLWVLSARNAAAQVGLVFSAARGRDEAVRVAAIRALGLLIDAQGLPQLIDLLVKAATSKERKVAEQALLTACRRIGDTGSYLGPLRVRLSDATPVAARCALLRVLARLEIHEALAILTTAAGDKDPGVQDTAIRLLAGWQNAAAIDTLGKITRSAPHMKHRILALRGYIRLAGQRAANSEKEGVELLRNALELASRVEEKKLAMGQLSAIARPEALKLVAGHLATTGLKDEARSACAKIVASLSKAEVNELKPFLTSLAEKEGGKLAEAIHLRLAAPYEAEDARLTAVEVNRNHKGFTGKGFTNFTHRSGGTIEWEISVGADARYRLVFRYALGGGTRRLRVSVDDKTIEKAAPFAHTKSWSKWGTKAFEVELKSGKHKVRTTSIGDDGPNVDNLTVVRIE